MGSIATTYPQVLGVLQRDQIRSRALTDFRAAGFTADQFARLNGARAAMVEALVRVEDWLELEHPRWTCEREAIRAIRRSLESELWP